MKKLLFLCSLGLHLIASASQPSSNSAAAKQDQQATKPIMLIPYDAADESKKAFEYFKAQAEAQQATVLKVATAICETQRNAERATTEALAQQAASLKITTEATEIQKKDTDAAELFRKECLRFEDAQNKEIQLQTLTLASINALSNTHKDQLASIEESLKTTNSLLAQLVQLLTAAAKK